MKRENKENRKSIQLASHAIPEEDEKKKSGEEKPYPDSEMVCPLGGHPLLASTTPIPDSFIQ